MRDEIICFVNDIANLDDKEKAQRTEDFVIMQLENFVLYNWSDEKDRDRELKNVENWLEADEQ